MNTKLKGIFTRAYCPNCGNRIPLKMCIFKVRKIIQCPYCGENLRAKKKSKLLDFLVGLVYFLIAYLISPFSFIDKLPNIWIELLLLSILMIFLFVIVPVISRPLLYKWENYREASYKNILEDFERETRIDKK